MIDNHFRTENEKKEMNIYDNYGNQEREFILKNQDEMLFARNLFQKKVSI